MTSRRGTNLTRLSVLGLIGLLLVGSACSGGGGGQGWDTLVDHDGSPSVDVPGPDVPGPDVPGPDVPEPVDVVSDTQADVPEPVDVVSDTQADVPEPVDVVSDTQADVPEPVDVVSDAQADVPEPVDVVSDALADVPEPVDLVGDESEPPDVSAEDVPAQFDGLPPDPLATAPRLDPTVPSAMYEAVAFLFDGEDPVQVGVGEGALTPRRVAVVRGRVVDEAGAALAGVRVAVKGHGELGFTLSREDGRYDLAVAGGGALTLRFSAEGRLGVDRRTPVRWHDWVELEEVALVPLDPVVTEVTLDGSAGAQVAEGSLVTDEDGVRKAAVLFPSGTAATMRLPDGTDVALTTAHIHATELTMGAGGVAAMPASLPPASAYTYCVDLSLEEAIEADAVGVRFDRPVPFYVDNFLGFPAGSPVPAGTYDRQSGVWEPLPNGLVIEIVGVSGALAELDVDGDGLADSAAALAELGVDEEERVALAATYGVGTSLWRVPLTHFTALDCNWPYRCRRGGCRPPRSGRRRGHGHRDAPCRPGSAVGCLQQTLGERIPVAGTPWSLRYSTGRVPGYREAYTVTIPVTPETLPEALVDAVLRVSVAGQRWEWRWDPPEPETHQVFEWDGLDAWGRVVQGVQPAHIELGYTYEFMYAGVDEEAGFGVAGSDDGWTLDDPVCTRRDGCRATVWRAWEDALGTLDTLRSAMGGWTLDAVHVYDREQGVLFRGDGRRRDVSVMANRVVGTVAGSGESCGMARCGQDGPALEVAIDVDGDLAAEPDGSVLFAAGERVARVTPEGELVTIAGGGDCEGRCCGDGGPAREAKFRELVAVDRGPDGTIYVLDVGRDCKSLRAIGLDGVIRRVAFDPERDEGIAGEGGPAVDASPGNPADIAVGPDGSVYVSDWYYDVVRVVTPDGRLRRFAGTGAEGSDGDGGRALDATLNDPGALAVASNGDVYIAERSGRHVRRVGPDGVISTVAGDGRYHQTLCEVGVLAEEACVVPNGLALGADGTLFIADGRRISEVATDGVLRWIAGTDGAWPPGTLEDGAPARTVELEAMRLTVSPAGDLLFLDGESHKMRRLRAVFDGNARDDVLIPSEDGRELFHFDAQGRHLDTTDTRTGAVTASFTYDEEGRIIAAADRDGNTTVIEREADGTPTALVGPWGHRTALSMGEGGWLVRATRPDGATYEMAYDDPASGLLERFEDARGEVYLFHYDDAGRLTEHDEPGPGSRTFVREELLPNAIWDDGVEVRMTTAEGRTTTFREERRKTGETVIVTGTPDGLSESIVLETDGTRTLTRPDGTIIMETWAPDPRFGMGAPVLASMTTQTPAGVETTATLERSVELSDPLDPRSLSRLTDAVTLDGEAWTVTYDAPEGLISATTPEGRTATTRLDARGRVVASAPPGLSSTSYAYDDAGLLLSAAVSVGGAPWTTAFGWDVGGGLASVTDAEGGVSAYARDALGRVVRFEGPGGDALSFAYDGNGNATAVTPPGREPYTMQWDPAGRLLQVTAPATGASPSAPLVFAYDADNRVAQITGESGAITSFTYADGRQRWTSLEAPDWGVDLSFNPLSGHIVGATTSEGEGLAMAWDGPLMTSVSWSGTVSGSVAFGWDDGLRLGSESVNGGVAVAYTYDADGRLIGAGDLVITRAETTGLPVATSVGVVTTAHGYDERGLLTHELVSVGAAAVWEVSIERDGLGRVVRRTESEDGVGVVSEYVYDDAGRLAEVWRDGELVERYTWDGNGDRTEASHDGAAAVVATYDARDRLTSAGTRVLEWAEGGQLLRVTDGAEETLFSHLTTGQLHGVTLPDSAAVSYVIDGLGRRVGRLVDGVVTNGWLYRSGLRIAAELAPDDTVRSRFVYGPGSDTPALIVSGEQTYRVITDTVGSPRLVIDTVTGEIVQRVTYDAFGRIVSDDNPGLQPFGFAGGLRDPDTGLVHFGARDYDPEAGRWIEPDPLGFLGGSSNLYAYALGDPVNGVDPTGLGGSDDCADDGREPDEAEGGDVDGDGERDDEFQIPSWLDSVMGLFGTLASAVGENLGWTSTLGRSLTVVGAASTVLTMPVAVAGARQTGEQVADRVIRQPQARREAIIREVQSEVFR